MSQVCPKLVTIFLLIRCMGQRASRLSNHHARGRGQNCVGGKTTLRPHSTTSWFPCVLWSDPDGRGLEPGHVRRHHGIRRPRLLGHGGLHLLHHPLHLWKLYPVLGITHTGMHPHAHTHTLTHTTLYIRTHTHTPMHTHMHTHTCTHTYMHTHAQSHTHTPTLVCT